MVGVEGTDLHRRVTPQAIRLLAAREGVSPHHRAALLLAQALLAVSQGARHLRAVRLRAAQALHRVALLPVRRHRAALLPAQARHLRAALLLGP